MRNIGFDESTVLREFARLAGEQGLVKQAAPVSTPEAKGDVASAPTPTSQPGPTVQTKPSTPDLFDDQLVSFPNVKAAADGKNIKADVFLKEIRSPEFKRFLKGWLTSNNESGKKKALDLKAKLMTRLKNSISLMEKDKRVTPEQKNAYVPAFKESLTLVSEASADDLGVKTATEKLYDVSGETAEDLVNSAHPGNTKVEVSNSKTKENVVETIVEQQERDIEVALKQPKGVYATLTELCGKLEALGYTDKLDGLKKIMAESDFIKIAESVQEKFDEKNAEIAEQVAKDITHFMDANNKYIYPPVRSKIERTLNSNSKSFFDMKGGLLSLVSEDKQNYNFLTNVLNKAIAKASDKISELADLRKEMQEQVKPGMTPEITKMVLPGTTIVGYPLAKGGTKAVQNWQHRHNKKFAKDNPKDANYLIPNGVWNKKTQEMYEKFYAKKAPAQQPDTTSQVPVAPTTPPASPDAPPSPYGLNVGNDVIKNVRDTLMQNLPQNASKAYLASLQNDDVLRRLIGQNPGKTGQSLAVAVNADLLEMTKGLAGPYIPTGAKLSEPTK